MCVTRLAHAGPTSVGSTGGVATDRWVPVGCNPIMECQPVHHQIGSTHITSTLIRRLLEPNYESIRPPNPSDQHLDWPPDHPASIECDFISNRSA